MTVTFAFDVYGTLIDTHGIITQLENMPAVSVDERSFSQTWRDKQLEYSFRRGLMESYDYFSVCTRHALEYTCLYYNIFLTDDQKQTLLSSYSSLPAFDDVKETLEHLMKADCHLYAFSNGTADAVETLLVRADIRHFFQGVVSVDDLKTFKPNPAVYDYFLRQTKAIKEDTWLISSNPFDVIGALNAGFKTAWIQRSKDAIFDPWGMEPTITISSLSGLGEKVADFCVE